MTVPVSICAGERKTVRLFLLTLGVALFAVALFPASAEARTTANNSFEQTAKDSCSDPTRTNRVFGTSWANNDGTVYGDTIVVDAGQNSVNANFYSSAFLCSDAGSRSNIQLISISDTSGNVSYSSSSIWRADSGSPGQFAGPDTSQQPMSITIDVSDITSSGTYNFSYNATYRDSNGTGDSASRNLRVRVIVQEARVTGKRVAGSGLTQSQVNGTPIRVRNPARCSYSNPNNCDYNSRDTSGETFNFTDVLPGNISITTNMAGDHRQVRHRLRTCTSGSTSDCSNWTSWSGWTDNYHNVDRSIAANRVLRIQFEYRIPPPPSQGSASGSCDSFSGTIHLDYEGSATVRFKAWLAGDPEPGWQQIRTYGSGEGETRNYSFNVPTSAKDAYRNTHVRVRHMYSPRSENNHDAHNGSIGECGDYFRYEPSVDSITNPDDRGNRKPSQQFSVRTSVYNAGENRSGTPRRGPSYNYQLEITRGSAYVVPLNSLSLSRFGIFEGQRSTIPDRNFRIVDTAPHDTEVCFRVYVEPAEDQTWPSSGRREYVNDRAYSNTECFNVYNQQFELNDISINGADSYFTPPRTGGVQEIRVRLHNQGDVLTPPPPINSSQPSHGRTHGVVTTLEIYEKIPGGSWSSYDTVTSNTQVNGGADRITLSYNHQIPNPEENDNIYCYVAHANPTAGWSDGSRWNGSGFSTPPPYTDTPERIITSEDIDANCENETRITTQSYFQAHRNDAHSGVTFAPSTSPLRGCSGVDGSRGYIHGTRTGTGGADYGSLGEYAGYALAEMSGFGTAATSTGSDLSLENFFTSSPGSARLAFANTPSTGTLGDDAYRCMVNLYEMLDKSGPEIVTVSGNVNLTPLIASGPAGDGDTQAYANGDITVSQTTVPPGLNNRRLTLIVNGDVTIASDISPHNLGNSRYRGNNMTIIARGNIRVAENVNRIDALLYAVPADGEAGTGASGVFDTCAGVVNLGTDVCGEQLVINGVVVADRVDLKRTHGGVSADRDREPAEIFRFSPLHFIRAPFFLYNEDAPRPDLEIQQMIDLPPRF